MEELGSLLVAEPVLLVTGEHGVRLECGELLKGETEGGREGGIEGGRERGRERRRGGKRGRERGKERVRERREKEELQNTHNYESL